MLKKSVILLAVFSAAAAMAAAPYVIKNPGEKALIKLPAVKFASGDKVVLKLRIYGFSYSPAGCNYSAVVEFNGKKLVPGQLIGSPRIDFLRPKAKALVLGRMKQDKLLLMYASGAAQADTMTADKKATCFEFDVTNSIQSGKENTVAVTNTRIGKSSRMDVIVESAELQLNSAASIAPAVSDSPLMKLPLEVVAKFPDVQIAEVQSEKELYFPAMPEKPGKVAVLRCNLFSYGTSGGGCNFNAQIKVNGKYLTRYTEFDSERLIGRSPVFGLHLGKTVREFQIFAGYNIMTIFAPAIKNADSAVTDKQGSVFLLDISDRVRGVDGNSITFRNIRRKLPGRMDLIIQNIQIGYLDKSLMPSVKSNVPERGPVKASIKKDGLVLKQGARGGFVLKSSADIGLFAETLMSVTHNGEAVFRAEDGGKEVKDPAISIKQNANGFSLQAVWKNGLQLERNILVKDNRLQWKELWSNKSSKALGVPFRHRFFLPDSDTKFYVAGDGDNGAKLASAQNPTIFLADKKNGNGFGISAENDWTRLLVGLRAAGGTCEIYSNQLALQPGKNIELEFAVDAETSGKSYWGFINRLRRRWLGSETLTATAPYFWICNYRDAPGRTVAEKICNAYAHLGPIIIPAARWSRLGWDAGMVISKKYPKKSDGSVDVEKFVTFEHRKSNYQAFSDTLKNLARYAPEVKLIVMTHPAMEVVYEPEHLKWPYAADEIKTVSGKCFNDSHYSRAHVGKDGVKNKWAVYYYVPSAGSRYAKMLKDDVEYQLKDLNGHGVYFDEFTFSGNTRGYSRYNYAASDGYSADLDAQGNVIRFKSDNSYAAAASRRELTGMVRKMGKLFYTNGGPALTSEQRMPVISFVEGGNGHGALAMGHLSQVPLALGNYGDYRTARGVFEAAKTALMIGTIYSPHRGCNLLFKDRDNFVCRMYPITIMELGPGTVKGKERIVTVNSGTLEWQVPDCKVKLYSYNAQGDLIKPIKSGEVKSGKIFLNVPANGMVIAERI